MPPPPIPFFSGRAVSVGETDGLLAIRPLRGHVFSEPAGTRNLYLPIATLVRVDLDSAALVFHGDFDRVDRPVTVRLAPLDPADAVPLHARINERYHLPRRPRLVEPQSLKTLTALEYIEVTGTVVPHHPEVANFEGVMLYPPGRERLQDHQRYHLTGFLHPARPRTGRLTVLGHRGARLQALTLEPA